MAYEYRCDYVMLVYAGWKLVLLHSVATFVALFFIFTIFFPMTGSRAYHTPTYKGEARTAAIVNASNLFLALLDEQKPRRILFQCEAQNRGKPV